MKSSVYLYGYCELEQEKNFIIDNKETLDKYIDYLDTFYQSNNFQYIKHDLEIVIKINDSQVDLTNNLINYCRIQNEDDQFPVYYFVTKIQAAAEHTNRVYLKMDTLTTFFTQERMTLNDKTKVIRQHKDRFFQKTSGQLQRKVDNISEGVQPIQFKLTESKIEDDNSNVSLDWYLIYRTQRQLSPDDISNPLNCYLVPSIRIPLQSGSSSAMTLTSDSFETGYSYLFVALTPENRGQVQFITSGSNRGITINDSNILFMQQDSANRWVMYVYSFDADGNFTGGQTYFPVTSITINTPVQYYYKSVGDLDTQRDLYYYYLTSQSLLEFHFEL